MRPKSPAQLEAQVIVFNRDFPVGTMVGYSPRIGDTPSLYSKVKEPAYVLSGHTAVCSIEGKPGCVALDALSPVER